MPAPWHMWGNSQTLELIKSPAPFDLRSPQLVKIAYGRPESWRFLFWATILEGPQVLPTPGVIQFRFNVTLGVGRANHTIKDFVTFIDAGPNLPTEGFSWWQSSAQDDSDALITEVPGQDIQVNCNVVLTGPVPTGTTMRVEVGSLWSPANHLRPEWYNGEFPGGEDKGS